MRFNFFIGGRGAASCNPVRNISISLRSKRNICSSVCLPSAYVFYSWGMGDVGTTSFLIFSRLLNGSRVATSLTMAGRYLALSGEVGETLFLMSSRKFSTLARVFNSKGFARGGDTVKGFQGLPSKGIARASFKEIPWEDRGLYGPPWLRKSFVTH